MPRPVRRRSFPEPAWLRGAPWLHLAKGRLQRSSPCGVGHLPPPSPPLRPFPPPLRPRRSRPFPPVPAAKRTCDTPPRWSESCPARRKSGDLLSPRPLRLLRRRRPRRRAAPTQGVRAWELPCTLLSPCPRTSAIPPESMTLWPQCPPPCARRWPPVPAPAPRWRGGAVPNARSSPSLWRAPYASRPPWPPRHPPSRANYRSPPPTQHRSRATVSA
mmetsp:Transcript_24131/g.67166  ORF Transcript_24131/g.67166 Transcript_24131/m.67166 type:complete len:216 (+) Transcript_24131:734-1381(+)